MTCEVCEVLKNGAMIEKYESCNEEGRKTSRSICEEMAKLQNSVCKCKMVEKLEERTQEQLNSYLKSDTSVVETKIIKTVSEAKEKIQLFTSDTETLLIADKLIDQMGANMAIIGDRVLKKGYMPTTVSQYSGYRSYSFAKNK